MISDFPLAGIQGIIQKQTVFWAIQDTRLSIALKADVIINIYTYAIEIQESPTFWEQVFWLLSLAKPNGVRQIDNESGPKLRLNVKHGS